MSIRETTRINKRYYEMGAGSYCGVYMPEHVMRKMVKLCSKYSSEVQKLLNDHKSELLTAHWGLAKLNNSEYAKPQTIIKYSLSGESVDRRISIFKFGEPSYVSELYVVSSYEESEKLALEIGMDLVEAPHAN